MTVFQKFQSPRPLDTSRRDILKLGVGLGAGLVIGAVGLPGATEPAAAAAMGEGAQAFTPYLTISPKGAITVLSKHLDKGQGVVTGLATLVAEELDADWSQMRPAFAPANDEHYKNLAFGLQGTGGSTSISNSFEQYRKAGAAARAMLVAAAAAEWQVPAAEIRVAGGFLTHGTRRAGFGELVEKAARLPVPQDPKLKEPGEWKLIGKILPRLDTKAKSTGQAIFTQDVKLPGMLVATLARPPRFGGKVKSFDATAAKQVKGVVDVLQVPQGVAVIAESTWPAIKGRDALKVEWDLAGTEARGSEAILADYRKLVRTPGATVNKTGDADKALAAAKTVIEADFEFPFLAHAPMEPMNAVVRIADGKVKVWTGAQLPTVDLQVAAAIAGVKPENAEVETFWAGGSFGRRAVPVSDYVAEATAIAKAHGQGRPIKLVWTREDDIKGGYYRPIYVHRVQAGLDDKGELVAWKHVIVGQSIVAGTPFQAMIKNGIDPTSVEGASNMPYAVPNLQVDLHTTKVGVPVLWWRSVGSTHTAYVVETLMDELAIRAGKDPVAFRLAMLTGQARHTGVLELAAKMSGWGTPLPKGRFRGVSVHESFQSYVAQVAEISLDAGGRMKVERVVCAVDCGVPVNPNVIAAQMEGGIGFGLGAVLRNAVTLTDGVVDQANFDTFEPLRMEDMPKVEVHIVPSTAPPTGVGEPGTPPIGPAVANAYAAGTGKRIRVLPFAKHGMV